MASFIGLTRFSKSNKMSPEIEKEKFFHCMKINDLLKAHGVESLKKGLDSQKAADYLLKYGPNQLPRSKSVLLGTMARNVFYGFGPVLCLASILSFLSFYPFGGTNPVSSTSLTN